MKYLYNYTSNKSIGIIIVMILITFNVPAISQVLVPFSQRTSQYSPTQVIYNIRGDFTMAGNTNLTLQNYSDNEPNSNNSMVYVDIDGDPTTINSSSANIQFLTENGAIPECSNVIYAGLYWTGRAHDDGNSPISWTQGGTTENYLNGSTANGYSIAISQTLGNTGFTNDRNATYLFSPSEGDQVILSFHTWLDGTYQGAVTAQVGSGPVTNIPITLSQNNYNRLTAIFDTPYQISTGTSTITINNLRKHRSDYTIDDDFRANISFGGKYFNKREVKFKHSTGSYQTIIANALDIYYPNNENGNMYSAYAEVTDIVQQYGIGEYFVADMALREGNGSSTGYYGGWGLIVVYENPLLNWRDVAIFDGHAYVVGGTTTSYEIPVTGFNTVQNGLVNMKLGIIAGEGDRTISGDYLQIQQLQTTNWVTLSHSGNELNNFFNSSISTGSNTRNPFLLNNTGLDIAMFDIQNDNNSVITNNQTTTKFKYGSTQDTYIISCIAMAVDAYIPEPEGLNTITLINGSTPSSFDSIEPGQDVVYTVQIRNSGSEPINDLIVEIPVPYTTNFVSASGVFYEGLSGPQPIYNASLGATGTIVWDFGYLPLADNISTLFGEITFTLSATTDCFILVNENCAPSVTVNGILSGTGANSQISFDNISFIQGYQTTGGCIGNPIVDPIDIIINSEEYVAANCQNVSAVRHFYYCNIDTSIPITEVMGFFPVGSRFYNEYPLVEPYTEYTISNPFPAAPGTVTYYSIPPGITDCFFEFTIEVTNIVSTPTTTPITYCQNSTSDPLTAVPSIPTYLLYYYTTPSGGAAQTSITPSTAVPGITTFYVAEGISAQCISPNRIPIVVTVTATPFVPTIINQSVCIGSGDVAFSATAVSGFILQWYDTEIGGAPSAITPFANTNIGGIYTKYVSQKMETWPYCESPRVPVKITAQDIEDPAITNCPESRTIIGCSEDNISEPVFSAISANSSYAEFSNDTNLGSATDNCSITSVSYIDNITSVPGDCPVIVNRNWTITDVGGNSANCYQTITIGHTEAPQQIGGPVPVSSTISCINLAIAPALPVVQDYCGNVLTPGTPTISGTYNNCEGTRIYSYTWTDCAGLTYNWNYTYNIEREEFGSIAPTSASVSCYDDITMPVPPQVYDNCGSLITNISGPVESAVPTCKGDVTYTWTYTDCEGNSQLYVHTVTIEREDFTLPANTTATVACVADISVPTPPLVNDACGNPIIPVAGTTPTAPSCEGTMVYSWTYTDCADNSHVWSHTVTIEREPFAAIQPTAATVTCAANIVLPTLPIVTDNCGTILNPTGPVISTIPTCEGDVTYTWTYTDCEGNTQLYVHTVTIERADFTLPVNGSETVQCVSAVYQPTPPVVTDACGTLISPSGPVVGGTYVSCEGTRIYTWTYTDCEGNTHVWTYTFNIDDNTAPVITTLAGSLDGTVECSDASAISAALLMTPTATDNCSEVVTMELVSDVTTQDITCENGYIRVRTWNFTDDCGNVSTDFVQTITVIDNTAPVITTLAGSLDVTVECSDASAISAALLMAPTAIDNCSEVVTSNLVSDVTTPDATCVNGYVRVRTWNFTDDCDNVSANFTQTITVEDNTAPVITAPAPINIVCDLTTDPTTQINAWLATAYATDNCDVVVTLTNDYEGFTQSCNEVITVTFNATDACGNIALPVTSSFTFVDEIAPVITTLAGSLDVTVECSDAAGISAALLMAPIATDNCSEVLTMNLVSDETTYDETCENGSIRVRTWNFTDDCGNVSTDFVQTITVIDNTAPVITTLNVLMHQLFLPLF